MAGCLPVVRRTRTSDVVEYFRCGQLLCGLLFILIVDFITEAIGSMFVESGCNIQLCRTGWLKCKIACLAYISWHSYLFVVTVNADTCV